MGASHGNPFGSELRRLRQAAGLTQEELAERAGLTAKGVGALERGDRRRPYPHTIRALASALGLSAEDSAGLASTVPRRGAEDSGATASRSAPFPSLPAQLLGREQDIEAIVDILRGDNRLLTLTGAGGVGKSSLSIEVGHRLRDDVSGGVVFVPLGRLDDPGMVLHSIAHALGLREAAGRSLRDVLIAALQDREPLVVLDNFEHLLPAAADVADLLAACPSTRILATSRAPLRLRGEREYVVSPLDIPDAVRPSAIVELGAVPSVRLFVQRGRAVSPSFRLTDENADAVAAICRRLDGLPLAIELAAARIRLLSPAALLARLDPLLPVLVGGSRDMPERQQTIRASITWSHDLLSGPERMLFRRLSVFAGGWTLEGAEALARPLDILDLLGRLVEASLVVRDTSNNRYRMLQPVREYAAEKLEESGEAVEIRDRHAVFFMALAREAEPKLKGPEQLVWLQRLDEDHDNVRAALSWLSGRPESGHREAFLPMAAALARYWFLRGHWSEGQGWLAKALIASPGDRLDDRAKALEGAGLIAQFQNDYEPAAAYLEESLTLYRQLGDRNGEAAAMGKLGFVAAFRNDQVLVEHLAAAVEPFISRLEDQTVVANLLIFLGLARVIHGEIDKGVELHDRALTIFRQLGDLHGVVWCLTNLGLLNLVTGDLGAATAVLEEDLGLALRIGEPASIQYALLGLATVASQEQHPGRAARLWGAAEAVRSAAGMELNPLARSQTMYDTWVEHARSEAGFELFATSWAEGVAMSMEQVLAYAMSPTEGVTIGER